MTFYKGTIIFNRELYQYIIFYIRTTERRPLSRLCTQGRFGVERSSIASWRQVDGRSHTADTLSPCVALKKGERTIYNIIGCIVIPGNTGGGGGLFFRAFVLFCSIANIVNVEAGQDASRTFRTKSFSTATFRLRGLVRFSRHHRPLPPPPSTYFHYKRPGRL